ncbi:putative cis-zeatin O-glucosyltransferase [Phragmites australis]|uniref:putative cis-zeatin O-glucosyltransferase n=1 Tax=Phragmites australis TaxID=29695 RepID=UPI002D7937AB|nr:putative cis-zeatin O-glucosyltransferase [Phragmites australis]
MVGRGCQMEPVAVVAVPFPAQGHLNQLLHLSLQLASRGLPVHYAAPAAHVRQARARVHGWDEGALRCIQFHELGISSYVSPPPDPTASSPFPSHLMPLFEAYTTSARAPLAALLDKLSASHRRVVVVYDRLNAFAAEETARLRNGEAFGLHCLALSTLLGKMDGGLRLLRERGLAFLGVEECASKEFVEYVKRARPPKEISPGTGILGNTCRALEAEFIDVVADHLAAGGKKLYAVGPLNPLLDMSAWKQGKQRHECLDWLDKQPPASVLYVSLGTTSSLRTEQIADLAAALRDSKQRFIWVLRDADRADIFADHVENRHTKLLAEFTKQTEGRGLVVTEWAPQLDILAHGATAAFMSHCGWNSTMESLSHGKPILAWPMHCDQPWDAELVCKYLKAGMLVRSWEKHNEVIPAEAIRQVIEDAMLSDEGMAVRQRAKVLGEVIRLSRSDGGSSRNKDLDDFIAYITR